MSPESNSNQNTPPNIPAKKPDERTPIKSLRTFQGDVQEAIAKNNFSTTKIFVAEQEKKLENPEPEQIVRKSIVRNNTFVYLGSIFVVLGLLTLGTFYFIDKNQKVEIEEKTKTLVSFSEEKKLQINGKEDLIQQFSETRSSWNMAVNSVLYTNLMSGNSQTGVEDMLNLITPSMLPSLKRSFDNKYMLGIYSFDSNEPFIILKVKDFPLAYSGMLRWEENAMNDLSGIFGLMSSFGTSTQRFVDESVKNKDLRILKNTAGNVLILYSFIDRETLIIAKNRNILSALVDKLLISEQTR